MFRESATARTYLRAAVMAAIAMSAVAGTIWIGNPAVQIITAGIGALATYLGVGAASKDVEPFYGRQHATVETPSPPAVDDEAPNDPTTFPFDR